MSAITTFFAAIRSGSASAEPLCFDIGSAVTKVAYRGKVVFCEPTCLAIHTQTQDVVAVGSAALALLGKTPPAISVVFPVKNGVPAHSFQLELYLTLILEKLSQETKTKIQHIVFGQHAQVVFKTVLSPAKQTLLIKVAKNAGITSLSFIPHARALAAQQAAKEQFVLDIGAQVTQLSISSLQEAVASHGYIWGGATITEFFQEYLRVRHGCVVSWHTAEQAKIELSTAQNPKHKHVIMGKDILTQASKTVLVQAGELQQHCTPYVHELLDWLEETFATLPSQVAVSLLQSGLTLTGGGSQLYGLSGALADRFNCSVSVSKQPQLDPVLGLLKIHTT